mmetsp:Transcript_12064/g.25833  ORF Transcript_12064/g.25833 Transcript_12064/m.25833 type:complete len:168 (-) Transcript_12064:225-728(-)
MNPKFMNPCRESVPNRDSDMLFSTRVTRMSAVVSFGILQNSKLQQSVHSLTHSMTWSGYPDCQWPQKLTVSVECCLHNLSSAAHPRKVLGAAPSELKWVAAEVDLMGNAAPGKVEDDGEPGAADDVGEAGDCDEAKGDDTPREANDTACWGRGCCRAARSDLVWPCC